MLSYLYFTSYQKVEKSWNSQQDFFVKTKTKTLLFVLEAPRDQDLGGLEDYITNSHNVVCKRMHAEIRAGWHWLQRQRTL